MISMHDIKILGIAHSTAKSHGESTVGRNI